MIRCVATDVVPLLAFSVGLVTLLLPFAIVRVQHVYVGGLVWPFISDLSRDYPASAVFGIGVSVLALLIGLMWLLNSRRHNRFLEHSILEDEAVASFSRWSTACNITGAVGASALPLYTCAKVATMPHRIIGGLFLGLEAVACIINSYLSYRVCLAKREELETGVFVTIKHAPRSVAVEKVTALKKAKRGFLVELACSALFVMSLLVYLPLLYQVIPAQRLLISQCLSRGYGDHYCNDTVRLDNTQTTLWNYEADFAGYQVRAFAQLGCLLTLLTYTLSFVVSNNERNEEEQLQRDRMYHAAVSSPFIPGSPSADTNAEARGRRRSRSRPGSPSKRTSRVRSPSGSPPERHSFSSTSPRTKSIISV